MAPLQLSQSRSVSSSSTLAVCDSVQYFKYPHQEGVMSQAHPGTPAGSIGCIPMHHFLHHPNHVNLSKVHAKGGICPLEEHSSHSVTVSQSLLNKKAVAELSSQNKTRFLLHYTLVLQWLKVCLTPPSVYL